ncbi:MAG: hypothetical protein HY721_29935 [Planctomycetes bacterium]|nr:hypothetical protein [Planctomycetota bacterium]
MMPVTRWTARARGWFSISLALFAILATAHAQSPPAPGTHGHYLVLTGKTHAPAPFASVDVVYGPREKLAAGREALWWELSARPRAPEGKEAEAQAPLFRLRVLTRRDPLASPAEPLDFLRYVLRLDRTGETLEYRDVRTGRALLPGWRGFERLFVPRRARATGGAPLPETAELLGHVLTLQHTGGGVAWEPWDGTVLLDLDPELLVGTGRNFRDAEGSRLPQKPERRNYTYVPFTREEYGVMIETGINLFTVDPKQAEWVRGKPVFFLRGAGGSPPLEYPADLYRSNYLGPVMFMDEPAIILVGDVEIHRTLRHFSDAAAALHKRIREQYEGGEGYSAFHLERSLEQAGANLGDMRLEQHDFPAWETLFELSHYELAAGLAGVVHEARYQLAPFDEAVARWSGAPRKHTARELLRYHYAFLRGAARTFEKDWGTSIYGQCDPAIAPEAVTLAYDMGARYVWFWTSDHDHHMPWPEQLELARHLKRHAAAHPRPSIRGPAPVLDVAIAIPDGFFVSLENLWWVRALDKERTNEASQRYNRLLRRVLEQFHRACDAGEDFDVVVDDGRTIAGYRSVVRVSEGE